MITILPPQAMPQVTSLQILLVDSCGSVKDVLMRIQPGCRVEVTTARGERIQMVALSGETNGRDVKVVWVMEPDEFEARGNAGHRIPWPSDAVNELA